MATGGVLEGLMPSYDSWNKVLFLLWDNYPALHINMMYCKCLERSQWSNNTSVGCIHFTQTSIVNILGLLKSAKQNDVILFYFLMVKGPAV